MESCVQEPIGDLERSALPPEFDTVSITIEGYQPEENHRMSDFFATNLSMRVHKGSLWRDFDKDGVPDQEDYDEVLDITYREFDSNGDGYRDLLIYLAGFDKESQRNLKECEDLEQDTDWDALTDCEENYLLHTNPEAFDTDNDGVPDFLEIYFGMNPNDPMDAIQDIDGDGLSNADEVRLNTPIGESNDIIISAFEYEYDVELYIDDETVEIDLGDYGEYSDRNQVTYNLRIDNIPITSTPEGNIVRFFFIEKVWYQDTQKELLELSIFHSEAIVGTDDIIIPYSELVEYYSEEEEIDPEDVPSDDEETPEG